MHIEDSVVLITGGASGLGEACARRLAAQNAGVVIMDPDQRRGAVLAEALGGRAHYYAVDVCDSQTIQTALDRALDAFGKINAVVNCAGVAPAAKVVGKHGPMDIEAFSTVIGINLIGTMNVIRLAAPHLMENAPGPDGERGVVINTASIAAFEGQVGQAAYSASKAGVVGLTLPLAREMARHGIRVVTIAPGLFDTPMMAALPEKVRLDMARIVPMPQRLGRPAEFAALAVHIIENTMLNGETIRLDGALRMGG